jgi:hypothetical protein
LKVESLKNGTKGIEELKIGNLKLQRGRHWPVIFAAILAGVGFLRAASPGADFDEVYELVRKNLVGASNAELEQAAVRGLIQQLYPQVSIVTNGAAGTNAGMLAATSILEGAYGYFRFNDFADGIDREFHTGFKRLSSTNKLKGLVLDLRFAGGQDYEAAANLADGFFTTRQPLADWGDGVRFAAAKTNAVNLPLTILVNKETRGAAEAFAGILRHSDIGLLIGDDTAGQASISREFALKNGQKLRIATTAVKIAGGAAIERKGLTPDIPVELSLAEERAFLRDAYRPVTRPDRVAANAAVTNLTASSATNRLRRRLNEAELVRMQREGVDLDSDFVTGREAGPDRPRVITDPVLARAVDLLKGLAVVHPARASF